MAFPGGAEDISSLLLSCHVLACVFPGLVRYAHSSIVLIFSQPPVSFSFHRLTLLSPVLTARTLPLRLQLARQATASKFRVVCCQSPEEDSLAMPIYVMIKGQALPSEGFVLVQILTVLSCEAEAMYALDSTVGDHATSRTQSP